ncbi:hypothetical protein PSP31121_05105 [Pandoraea sputorum]|uniref:CCHC-type domain-containing protein n=1 Tax=Pandoraea sputorum TaxID=93222 RepID=A0A5E5BJ81_9BURK|nr:hypothetical protein PSP31121_05105 [Pandoraea sputorum]
MNRDYCFRCGQYGHCSEDCPLLTAQISRPFAIAYACVLLGVALLSLIGVAALCADALAYPTFGSFK